MKHAQVGIRDGPRSFYAPQEIGSRIPVEDSFYFVDGELVMHHRNGFLNYHFSSKSE